MPYQILGRGGIKYPSLASASAALEVVQITGGATVTPATIPTGSTVIGQGGEHILPADA